MYHGLNKIINFATSFSARGHSLKCGACDDDKLISCSRRTSPVQSSKKPHDENEDANELAGDVSAFLHGHRPRTLDDRDHR